MNCQPSQTALLAITQSIDAGLILIDASGRVRFWNRWVENYSGISASAACDKTLAELFPEIANSRLTQAVDSALKYRMPALLSPALHGMLLPLYQTRDARHRHQRLYQLTHVIPLEPPEGPACLIQIADVSASISRERQLRQRSEMLRHSNTLDALTGLNNRSTFDQMLATAFAKARERHQPLALLVSDIDHLSDFNQQVGHDAGDELLRQIGAAFSLAVERPSDITARYAGDKFAALLPQGDAASAQALARKIAARLRQLHLPGNIARPRIHLGLAAIVPDRDSDTDSLVSSAEVALFHAKQESCDKVVYFDLTEGTFSELD